jgi:serine/threonine protein kinase
VTRYELLDRIGVGGMAEIFRGKAVAAGGFEKPVAIKRILPHLSQDPRFVELLIAEAKILSLLKHRNIVQIFDVGLGDDGKYFLVMEYVDGKDLGAIQRGLEARRRKLPLDLALHVAAEMCEALEHAHTARAPDGRPMTLVHRDVSPSNVLLSRAGEVKLTDFGIAKRAEHEQTGHGAVRGKFAYISPEQARNEHIDPRSDVFAVGILMWELICNRRLFSALPDLEALRAVRDGAIQRPTELDPRLSPEIDQLVMWALSRDIKKRPSAGELGAKLRAMRYSMEATVGDPATELAKIIDAAEDVERQSQQVLPEVGRSSGFDFDPAEMTVIRIRTADAFSMRDINGAAAAQAKAVIERFEEEETRLAQLSGDQMRMLREGRDSGDLGSGPAPLPQRARRQTDEATIMRSPISTGEASIITPPTNDVLVPDQPLESDEHTRMIAPRDRRTPMPERGASRDRGTPGPSEGCRAIATRRRPSA